MNSVDGHGWESLVGDDGDPGCAVGQLIFGTIVN